jgi:hypothetical protein
MRTKNKSLKPVVSLLRSRRVDWTLEPGSRKELSDLLVVLDHCLTVKDVRRARKAADRLARVFLRDK